MIGRLREKGYIRLGYDWVVGEDLHWTTAEESTPAETVQAWMDSAIHRKYLLNPKFDELGVGAVRGVPYNANLTDGITVAAEFGFRPAALIPEIAGSADSVREYCLVGETP